MTCILGRGFYKETVVRRENETSTLTKVIHRKFNTRYGLTHWGQRGGSSVMGVVTRRRNRPKETPNALAHARNQSARGVEPL